jgi:two-component system, OmpR family, sensor kinase
MTRHFLGLYVLIVLTLAAVSWGQDKLLQTYSNHDSADDRPLDIAVSALRGQLSKEPVGEWKRVIADSAAKSGVEMELFAKADIAGNETLAKLERGTIAYMQAAHGESWALKQLNDDYVLALRVVEPETRRGLLDWGLTLLFYAAIALVIMIWIWPLTRDLRVLEKAAAHFGNRNWLFDADIKPRSQIYPLAETFRKMAARIDGLIASHQDMSNAVSHEIKTPLARMQFEIESAQQARSVSEAMPPLANIKKDIAAIDDLVRATLDYAILERADMSLNIGVHNFTALIPAISEYVKRDTRPDIQLHAEVRGDAERVNCDVHLLELVLKNLLYNATRYAKSQIRVAFCVDDGINQLLVDDDGPGIPEGDRQRVFKSFVQLETIGTKKVGFGLGLAIVKRAIEWHSGEVVISQSPLGGARFCATWPSVPTNFSSDSSRLR